MNSDKTTYLKNRFFTDKLEAGCDEAGRGPLVGAVFAAAVILPDDFSHPLLNDSKKMSASAREELREVIKEKALAWAVEAVSPEEIDKINILNASILGMWRSIVKLKIQPEALIIDGNRFKAIDRLPEYSMPSLKKHIPDFKGIDYQTFVKGDGKYASIAAASVLAKTYRDDYMRELSKQYPQYGWEHNMGYPTAEHIECIKKYGLTPYHRKSFKPKELDNLLF